MTQRNRKNRFPFTHSNTQRPKGRRNHRFIVDELTSGQVNQLLVDRVNKRQSNR